VRRDAAQRSRVQASDLRNAEGMISYISLGPLEVRVELVAVTPTGPYRLEVDHPEKKIVEYFDTPFAALLRHAEIEAALQGKPLPTPNTLANLS
jgi:hypothetical protein